MFISIQCSSNQLGIIRHCLYTSHSAYVAISTKSDGVKIDEFLYPNFFTFQKCKRKFPTPFPLSFLKPT